MNKLIDATKHAPYVIPNLTPDEKEKLFTVNAKPNIRCNPGGRMGYRGNCKKVLASFIDTEVERLYIVAYKNLVSLLSSKPNISSHTA